ncbi:hypothetical protein BDM02DRAFT_3120027 [Thelephora ganbajun]|uniref:Uncharacterized protein n=1 Tax=Thelephora ganbajun TaxID=370292 RepID=A0ACB6Z887_THEGA|nr:hypothetical protein BDM02DRAFT_3120027 [Thelephora ganbajun]
MGIAAPEKTTRPINWLFFDPANTGSLVHTISVPSHLWDISVEDLDWVAALKKWFRFRACLTTMKFWTPEPPLPLRSIGEDWIDSVRDVESIARFCQPALPIKDRFDDPYYVHLIIAAKELVEDADTEAVEERALVSGLPLHVVPRYFEKGRKPSPVPPSKAATSKEYAKLQKNPKTVIYNGFYACPTFTTIALPVEIFHQVFRGFLDRIADPKFKPTGDIISIVSRLMTAITEIHTLEDIAPELCPLLADLLGKRVEQIASANSRTPDGMALKILGNHTVALRHLHPFLSLLQAKTPTTTRWFFLLLATSRRNSPRFQIW